MAGGMTPAGTLVGSTDLVASDAMPIDASAEIEMLPDRADGDGDRGGVTSSVSMEFSCIARTDDTRVSAARAEEPNSEPTAFTEEMNRAIQRSIDSLTAAPQLRSAIIQILRIMSEVLSPLGLYDIALNEVNPDKQTLRVSILLREGKVEDLVGSPMDRDWSLNDPAVSIPWTRIEGHDFVWGSTSDPNVLLPELKDYIEHAGARAVAYVPMRRGIKTIGWIALSLRSEQPLTRQQINFVRALVGQVSLAVEFERVAEAERQRSIAFEREQAAEQARQEATRAQAEELRRANEALRKGVAGLASFQDLDRFLAEMLKAAAETAGAHAGAVALLNESQSEFRFVTMLESSGSFTAPDSPLRKPFSITPELLRYVDTMLASPDGWALSPADPLIFPAIRLEHKKQGNLALQHIPMRVGERLVGWLGLGFADAEPRLGSAYSLLQVLADQMTMAVEMLRLSEEAKLAAVLRERETQAKRISNFLVKSVAGLTDGADPSMALSSLITELAHELGACHVYLFRHDTESRTLRLQLTYLDGTVRWGMSGDEVPLFATRFPDDISPAWQVMCDLRRFFTPDMCPIPVEQFAWPGAFEYKERFGFSDLGHIVLFAGDCPVGSLGFAFRDERRIQDADRPFIEAAAQQAAIAIRMLDLGEKAKEAAIAKDRAIELWRAYTALGRTVTQLTGTGGLTGFLESLLREALAVTGAVSGTVFVLDEITQRIRQEAVILRGRAIDPATRPPNNGYKVENNGRWKFMVETGKIHWADYQGRVEDDWPGSPAFHHENHHRFVAGIPMVVGERIIGFLAIAFDESVKTQPPDESLDLTRLLGMHAALAVRLTHLAKEARDAAILQEEERAVVKERARISREIHDVLAQGFTGILMQLGAANEAAEIPTALKPYIRRIEDLARSNLAEARRSVQTLRTCPLPDALPEALKTLANQVRAHYGQVVEVLVAGTPQRFPDHVESELVQIAREAVTNTLKHASAEETSIDLKFGPGPSIRLRVKDNGKGIRTADIKKRGHFGLQGMQERAESIGAALTIVSEEGFGTEIVVAWQQQ